MCVSAVSDLLLLLWVPSGGSSDQKVIAGTRVNARVVDRWAVSEHKGALSASKAGQDLDFHHLAG